MAAAVGGVRRGRLPLWPLAIAGLIVALLGITFAFKNQTHAGTKHASASIVRDAHRRGACVSVEAYFSPVKGTVMVLCDLDADGVGGMVFRFTENNGSRLLGADAYETTCFVDTRHYWNGVIARDGYWTLGGYTDIEAKFWTWFWANL